MASYVFWFINHWNVVVEIAASMSYFVTLSTPSSGTEPHGKVTASATPLSITSRTSVALACTLVPPSSVTQAATVACEGRTFIPLMSPGTTIFFLLECQVSGSRMKEKQYFTSFISFGAYLRYQASTARMPPLASPTRNGNSPAEMMGKRPG